MNREMEVLPRKNDTSIRSICIVKCYLDSMYEFDMEFETPQQHELFCF
jgi:hypothetical protein